MNMSSSLKKNIKLSLILSLAVSTTAILIVFFITKSRIEHYLQSSSPTVDGILGSFMTLFVVGFIFFLGSYLLFVLLSKKFFKENDKFLEVLNNLVGYIKNGDLEKAKNYSNENSKICYEEFCTQYDDLNELSTFLEKYNSVILTKLNSINSGSRIDVENIQANGDYNKILTEIESVSVGILSFLNNLDEIFKNIKNGKLNFSIERSNQNNAVWEKITNEFLDVIKMFQEPLYDIKSILIEISKGNLKNHINENRYVGEIKETMSSLLNAQTKISDFLNIMANNSFVINSVNENVSDISNRLVSSADNSVEQINVVSDKLEELSDNGNNIATSIQEMSINAQNVANDANEMVSYVKNITSKIDVLTESINNITSMTETAAEISSNALSKKNSITGSIEDLHNSVTEIGNITSMIKKIAEQTNLLALNATIEAASAGEAGKGFAVVANEIKELANQSANSAEMISEMVNKFQSATSVAVKDVQDIGEIIENIEKTTVKINREMEKEKIGTIEISENSTKTFEKTENVTVNIQELASVATLSSEQVGDMSNKLMEISESTIKVRDNVDKVGSVAETLTVSTEKLNMVSSEIFHVIKEYKFEENIEQDRVDYLFKWDDEKFNVGINAINDEHHRLVDLVNELYRALTQGKGKNAMTEILKELVDYTDYHFTDEENYMEKFNFPKLPEHKVIHQKFVETAVNTYKDLESGKISVSMNLLEFLKDWLINHILGEDKKYFEFFNQNNIDPNV